MNQIELRDQLTRSINKESFFDVLNSFNLKEVREEGSLIIEELAMLHNEGVVDLNDQFIQLKRSDQNVNFYNLISIYCYVLPKLICPVVDALNLYFHFKSEEIPTGSFGDSYFLFCKKSICRSKKSISYLLEQTERQSNLLTHSLMAAAELDYEWVMTQFSSLIAHQNSDVRRQTYFAIANVSEHIDDSPKRRLALFEKMVELETDESARSGLFHSTVILAKKASTLWPSVNVLLEKCLLKLEPLVLYQASQLLAFGKKDAPEDTIQLLMPYFKHVQADQKDIFNNLTYFIDDKIKAGQEEEAEKFLADLLTKVDGISVSDFQQLSHQLTNENRRVFLNKITSKWLLSGDVKLCRALFEVIGSTNLNVIDLKFDKALLPLSGEELFFIARKTIGWFFHHPTSAISFILSLLPYVSDDLKPEFEKLTYNPLLLCYPGELNLYLQSCIDKNNQIQFCENLLNKLQAYHVGINKVSGLKEMMAPSENVSTYWRQFNKEMQGVNENASESSLMSLFTTQNLLYGNSAIHYIYHGDGKQVRQEMKMQSISHSTEMPRLNVLDPESLDYLLRVFRVEGLDK